MKFYEPTNRLVKSVLSQTFYIISGSVRFVKGFFEFSLLSDNFFSGIKREGETDLYREWRRGGLRGFV